MVGLIANLVTRELRRCENEDKGLPPEHPRAGLDISARPLAQASVKSVR